MHFLLFSSRITSIFLLLTFILHYTSQHYNKLIKLPGYAVQATPNHVRCTDCPTTQEQWDRLVNKSLSGSDFDLMIHNGTQGKDVQSPSSV